MNRRTGTRWRYGRTVINRAGQRLEYPPVKTVRRYLEESLSFRAAGLEAAIALAYSD